VKSVNHSGSFDLLIRGRKRTGKSPAVSLVYSFHFIMTFLAVTDIISGKKKIEKQAGRKRQPSPARRGKRLPGSPAGRAVSRGRGAPVTMAGTRAIKAGVSVLTRAGDS